MISHGLLSIVLFSVAVAALAQKNGGKGSPETAPYAAADAENLARVQNQLIGALAILEGMEESNQDLGLSAPMKVAEKRRNKFEFIRFGRK